MSEVDLPPEAPLSRKQVLKAAALLSMYANHFVPRDWCYTRDLGGLKAIKWHEGPYDALPRRLRRALRDLFGPAGRGPLAPRGLRMRVAMAQAEFRLGNHLPDGVLNRGNIITYWEETGEYLQLVQPSVGALIAAWLESDPDNPHAVAVAAEIQRIDLDYAQRLRAAGLISDDDEDDEDDEDESDSSEEVDVSAAEGDASGAEAGC